MKVLTPEGWASPIGYSNGIAVQPGHIVFIAGQIGWDAQQKFHSSDFAPQFEQALRNVLAVLDEAGGKPEHICRITAYCCDKQAYLGARPLLGRIWRGLMGKHYPAMSMIFVADLLDHPGLIELEATAVVPLRGRRAGWAKPGGEAARPKPRQRTVRPKPGPGAVRSKPAARALRSKGRPSGSGRTKRVAKAAG